MPAGVRLVGRLAPAVSLRLLRFAHPFGAAFGWLSPFGRLTTGYTLRSLRPLPRLCNLNANEFESDFRVNM